MNSKSKNGTLKKRIGVPLVIWGLINTLAGIFYLFCSSELLKGILLQAFFWGFIDGILGAVILLRKKAFHLAKIKRIFLVNVYLDVIYVVIGVLLIAFSKNAFLMGNGIGVSIQGFFLFVVDLIHHRNIKKFETHIVNHSHKPNSL
jgi:hypothetical protein